MTLMRFAMFLCASIAASVSCVHAPRPIADMTPVAWQEDLDWTVDLLMREHPALFSYHAVDSLAFRGAVDSLRSRIPDLAPAEVMLGLDRLVASVGDGHTSLDAVQPAAELPRYPLVLSWFGNRLGVIAMPAGDTEGLGAEVIAIDGVPAVDALARISVLISHDNAQEFQYASPAYLVSGAALAYAGVTRSPGVATYTLQLQDRVLERRFEAWSLSRLRQTQFVTAPEAAASPVPLYRRHPDQTYWIEPLTDRDALYVKWDRVDNASDGPSLRRFFDEIFDAVDTGAWRRVIVDLRSNRGGNYLKARPFIEGVLERPALLRPGTLIVLTGPQTFSAATYVASQLHFEAGAVIVGEPSRGNPNFAYNSETVALPHSGLHLEYTDRLQETPPFPELGPLRYLPVSVRAYTSLEDYIEGIDRVLEVALAYDATDANVPEPRD